MGGGDLNLKKSWHPNTLKNQEKVWKAEQHKKDEDRKIEEIMKEIHEERIQEDLLTVAHKSGAIKEQSDKLKWMYKTPAEQTSREEYLLGRKVDKTLEMINENEASKDGKAEISAKPVYVIEHEVAPESFLRRTEDFHVDLKRKILEDPLYQIRHREEAAKTAITSNPIKMKNIQKLLESSTMKSAMKKKKSTKKKKHKKEKKKKKKKKVSSSSSDSSDHESIDEAIKKMLSKQKIKATSLEKGYHKHSNLSSERKYSQQTKYSKRERFDSTSPQITYCRRRRYNSPSPQSSNLRKEHYNSSSPKSANRIRERFNSPSAQRGNLRKESYKSPSPQRENRRRERYNSRSPQYGNVRRERYNSRSPQHGNVRRERYNSPSPQRGNRRRERHNVPSPEFANRRRERYNSPSPVNRKQSISYERILPESHMSFKSKGARNEAVSDSRRRSFKRDMSESNKKYSKSVREEYSSDDDRTYLKSAIVGKKSTPETDRKLTKYSKVKRFREESSTDSDRKHNQNRSDTDTSSSSSDSDTFSSGSDKKHSKGKVRRKTSQLRVEPKRKSRQSSSVEYVRPSKRKRYSSDMERRSLKGNKYLEEALSDQRESDFNNTKKKSPVNSKDRKKLYEQRPKSMNSQINIKQSSPEINISKKKAGSREKDLDVSPSLNRRKYSRHLEKEPSPPNNVEEEMNRNKDRSEREIKTDKNKTDISVSDERQSSKINNSDGRKRASSEKDTKKRSKCSTSQKTEEELIILRNMMMAAAKKRDEERKRNVENYDKQEQKELEEEKNVKGGLRTMHHNTMEGSVENNVRSRIAKCQRSGQMESNFLRK